MMIVKRQAFKRLVSALAAVCMAVSLMPVPLASYSSIGDDQRIYEYTGTGLDKEYDGEPVSMNFADITVNGETGVLNSDNAVVAWYSASGSDSGQLNSAPSEVGEYYALINLNDSNRTQCIEIDFVIYPVGHEHIFGEWSFETPYDDCHMRECVGDQNNQGCGLREIEHHNATEWIIDTENDVHYKHCSVCDSDYDVDNHNYVSRYDASGHWEECSVCGDKMGKEDHQFSYEDNNDGTHTVMCVECDYTATEDHEYGEWYDLTSVAGKQRRACVCGATEDRDAIYTITYDYTTNGGTSASVSSKEAVYNSNIDITPTAVKDGYEFIGWSLQSSTDIIGDDVKVTGNMTLYAIFRKTVGVKFYATDGSLQTTVNATVYNNDKSFDISELYPSGLTPAEYEGYSALGWTDSTEAGKAVKTIDLIGADQAPVIPDVFKDYYAMYTRALTLSYNTDGSSYDAPNSSSTTQFYNASGKTSSAEFVLPEIVDVTEDDGFLYWADGSKSGKKYSAGDYITISENTTMYAVWQSDIGDTVKQCTVTYDYQTNGGTSSSLAGNTKTVIEGLNADMTPTATKAGYDFIGWNTDKDAHTAMDAPTVSDDLTLYAIFKKTITASFYQPEAVAATRIEGVLYNNDTKTEITAPTLNAYEGWTVAGWTTSLDSAQITAESGKSVEISDNTSFYGVYSRELNAIFHDGNNEDGSPINAVDVKGTQYYNLYVQTPFAASVIAPSAPEKDGFIFNGWRSISGAIVDAGATTTITSNNSYFNAQWSVAPTAVPTAVPTVAPTAKPTAAPTAVPTAVPTEEPTAEPTAAPTQQPAEDKTVSVRFYSGLNGTLQSTINVKVLEDGSHEGFVAKTPTAIGGWTALGWRTDDRAQAPQYGIDESVASGTATEFYAVYSRDLSLTFDTEGGDEVTEMKEIQYYNSASGASGVQFTLPSAPSKNGDIFSSWAISGKAGEKHNPGDVITLSQSTTAHAIWQSFLQDMAKYTVTYDYQTNGGTSVSAQTAKQAVTVGTGADLTVAAEKAGYEFVGWNTDQNAHNKIDEYTVTGDVTLYAIYKKELTASFYQIGAVAATEVKAVEYNNEPALIAAPALAILGGYEADGWRSDTDAKSASYKGESFIKLTESNSFYPVYKRMVTLTYNTNGSSETIKAQSAVQYKNGTNQTTMSFTLADALKRDGYTFTGWSLSNTLSRAYSAGEIVALTDSAVATAVWQKTEAPASSLTVTYDYKANGGTSISATAPFMTVSKGGKANLSFESEKAGWVFVGWNTDKDAHEALSEYTVTADVTLYAIFKKDVTASFYSGSIMTENGRTDVSGTIWNNDKFGVEQPNPITIDGWTFDGWRTDGHTTQAQYRSGEASRYITHINADTTFYAVYKREITVTGETADTTMIYTQYLNTLGGEESVPYRLSEPKEEYREAGGNTERFAGWEVVTTDDNGNEVITEQSPGGVVNVQGNASVRAKYIMIPDGASLPKVETVGSTVISPTQSLVIKSVENDNISGNELIREGFVYWSKLGDGTKYTVNTQNTHMALEFLAPDTEYYYYAFAENAAGVGKGYIKSFRTEPDDNTPTALMINPEYVSIEKGEIYQLLATLLPVAAENKILWSSSDESKVTVDENGMLTAHEAGEGIIITATTEIGRLTAECIVDVTETSELSEMNFSEWHMASHTYNGAANGFDWDTEDRDGGNHIISTAYLARWEGAVMEDDDPYPEYSQSRPSKTAEESYHVQNVDWLPKRESWDDNDEIKAALMENGAVYTMMCIDWGCFSDGYTNYYCPEPIYYNGHAVTIVGWDDNYSRRNFKNATPPHDGAFICKNSWGEGAGEGGFFYISYDDANTGRLDSNAVVIGAQSNSNYNTIYQYDPLGAIGYLGFDDTTFAANVFPENGKSLTQNEDLKAVSFYTYHKNTSYDVYIVTDYTNKNSIKNLTSPLASGVIKNSGYHTVNLDNSVSLKAGTRFAVVVKLDVPEECSYVYCEYPVEGYSSKARANADESYISYDGEDWADLTAYVDNANFCIKAFTDNGTALQSAKLYSAIDNENRKPDSDKVYMLSEAEQIGMDVNEDYIRFKENENKTEYGISLMSGVSAQISLGSMPSIIKAGSNTVTYTEGARFPSRYNLAEMGLVSSVKDQGSWGTCWAHATYASLESCMLRTAKTTSADESDPQVILSRRELTMAKDSSMTLAKKITPLSAYDKTVVWMSSDDSVARVDTNGTIRAVGEGNATISATTISGGYSGRCSVVVAEESADEVISFEEKAVRKEVGDKFMVAYSVTPMRNETYSYGWISDNPNVASVNDNGVITARADGTASISILSEGIIKDTVTVEVGNGLNNKISNIDNGSLTYSDNKLTGSVTLTVTSNLASDTPAEAAIAIYNSEGALVGVVSKSQTLRNGENEITIEDIELDISGDEYIMKCFVWNSQDNMLPLAEAQDEVASLI